MNVFRPVPIDVIVLYEKVVVDLFIKHQDMLVPFLEKGGVFTRDHLLELHRFGISRIYVRRTDAGTFEEYIHENSDKIINDSTIPGKVKAATFYVSSMHALRKAFEDPNSNQIEVLKNTLKPMFKNIMKNRILLNDLFSITEHDFNTYTHSVNVGIFATALAIHFYTNDRALGMEELERLTYGYFLHDIGKCKIPKSILSKRGNLDDHEWAIMKKHPEFGYTILMETGHLTDEAAYISMQHHERPNGSGYPFGMTDIHPCARICAIADIFDALTSERPYKKPMKPFDAIEIIKTEAITEFDNNLLSTFIRMLGPHEEVIRLSQATG
ncbi:MAG TPA: HD domain-containing protein [Deltaproteobacteria bacterium]|mgnify:CR=1 FL=1|nr:HD domain-containing protein [Deltaproteobacteria bacterium]